MNRHQLTPDRAVCSFQAWEGMHAEGVGMAAHASWKGFLKLSLVSVPVKAYTATASGNDITLHQLHAKTHTRIQYKKFAPEVGEVSSDEIVKGYEYDKGQYVIIDEDEIDKLRTESDKSIRIDGFIEPDALSSDLPGRPHLLPDARRPRGAEAVQPAHEGHGVQRVVRHRRGGHRAEGAGRAGQAVDGVLAMTVLNRKDEVKAASAFKDEITETEATEAEKSLADTLIKASIIKDFDFSRYQDVYKEKLTKLIQMKIEGKEVVQVRDPEEPKIINLMEALKRSVEEAQAAGRGRPRSAAAKAGLKQAPSAKPAKAASVRPKKKKVG